ncbi:Transporter of the ATP-binding cassette (ABC) [Blastocladiella emersonii ATCC 22665]|nr:Transporter of the ATP-binding cassette (ABC) [Blastocladiella emersonii ATCC 22665]
MSAPDPLAACTAYLPLALWNDGGIGLSPCFLDTYVGAGLPAATIVGGTLVGLWCNRASRHSYALVGEAEIDHDFPHHRRAFKYGSALVSLSVLELMSHVWRTVLLLESSSPDGPVVASIARVASWLLALILAITVVLKPNQLQFRGYIPWISVFIVFLLVDLLCSTTTFLSIQAPLASLGDVIALGSLTILIALGLLAIAARLLRKERVHGSGEAEPLLHDAEGATLAGSADAVAAASPQVSRELTASLLSLALFNWFQPIIDKGAKKSLEIDDLWDLYPSDKAAESNAVYSRVAPRSRSLVHGLWLSVRHHLILQIVTGTLGALLAFTGPFFLSRLLNFMQDGNPNTVLGFAFVLFLFLGTVFKSILDNQTYNRGRRIGTRVRAILIGQVYAKALRAKDKTANVGKVMNMMQIDANKILEFSCYIHYFITTPMQIVIAIAALYQLLGWASFAGVGVMLCVVPLNAFTGNRATTLQQRLMGATDERTQVATEIFSGIRLMKTLGWEFNTLEWMRRVRDNELFHLRNYLDFTVALSLMWYIVPLAVTMSTFWCYAILMGQELTATKVFTAIALFMTLKLPLFILPDMVIRYLEVKVSLDRIVEYLAESEVVPVPTSDDIRLDGASFSWTDDNGADGRFTLKDLTLRIPRGGLTLIVGKTGQGKSSLASALFGEMNHLGGSMSMPHSVAYVPQQAWLQNDSIKGNILFGASMNRNRYNKVIRACAMTRDLEILPAGDGTEVGSSGQGLSGGQRQRLNLARAAYSQQHSVIIDDSLSALDVPSAKFVFEECILGFMRGRTRVLVTHAVSLTLSHADHVIVVDGGRIRAQGTPAEVSKLGVLDELLQEEQEQLTASSSVDDVASLASPTTPGAGPAASANNSAATLPVPEYRRARQLSLQSTGSVEESSTAMVPSEKSAAAVAALDAENAQKGRMVIEEDRCRGSVEWRVYRAWIDAAGGLLYWAFLLAFLFLQQLGVVGQDLFLRYWTNAYNTQAAGSPRVDVTWYISVYVLIGALTLVAIGTRLVVQFRGSMRASRYLHDELFRNLLYAKIRFFDVTPLGRIINRLSRDMQTIDRDLARDMVDGLINGYQLASILVMIVIAAPAFLVFLVPIGLAYFSLSNLFLATSRELKRIDSLTRSPIFSLFSETLTGTSVIRAYRHETRFLAELYKRIDVNHRAFFFLWVSNRWLTVRTDLLGAFIVLSTGIVLMLSRSWMDPALMGIILSYALNVVDCAMWLVRVQALVEMDANSVERVDHWLHHIEQEPMGGLAAAQLPPNWPAHGAVEVRDLTVQYSATAGPVLHGITFKVPPRSRLACCGRTGAGKSSFATAIFRLVEWASGEILIDGVNVGDVDLHMLRSKITMVPQDPVLLSGTIRSNLDIFAQFSDPELVDVLNRVHLGHLSLDDPVTEGGSNLSVGMRQMVSLGRALLRRSRVLVLDEATAAMDSASDAAVQDTIRTQFTDCTIITIAHRLQTIIDYDYVLVLDAGRVAQFGSPRELMLQDGIFHRMCRESNDFDSLLLAAK